jgi:hypothetical protein
MNYIFEKASDAVIYTSSFIHSGSGLQEVMGGGGVQKNTVQ